MRITAIFAVMTLMGTGMAQQTAPDSNVVIRSSTREVLLEVSVRDAHGKLVNKIDPAQVEVYENGVRQEIKSFRLVQGSEVRSQDEKQMAEQQAQTAAEPNERNPPPPPSNALRTVNVVCLVLNDLTPETRAFAFDAAQKFVKNELRPDTFIGVFSMDSSWPQTRLSFFQQPRESTESGETGGSEPASHAPARYRGHAERFEFEHYR